MERELGAFYHSSLKIHTVSLLLPFFPFKEEKGIEWEYALGERSIREFADTFLNHYMEF